MSNAASDKQNENAQVADLALVAGIIVEGVRQRQSERCYRQNDRDNKGPGSESLEIELDRSASQYFRDFGVQKQREQRVCAVRHILNK